MRSPGTRPGSARQRVRGAIMMRLASSRSPILIGSKSVGIALLFLVAGLRNRSELLADPGEECLDDRLVALKEVPLADFATDHQTGALQGCQMSRNGGLRKPGPLVDLSGADAVLQRVKLVREETFRLLQPSQDVPAQRVGKRLDDLVEVVCHESPVCLYRVA